MRLYIREMTQTNYLCQEKKEEEDLSIQRLEDYFKRKIDYGNQKSHKQHENPQKNDNKETEVGRKTTIWIF